MSCGEISKKYERNGMNGNRQYYNNDRRINMVMWNKIWYRLMRNRYSIDGKKSKINRVNLEWWHSKINIGDTLSKVIYGYITDYYGLDREQSVNGTVHLNAVGSIMAMKNYDAVVWGSGIHCASTIKNLMNNRKYVNYDVRAVRGPLTEKIMEAAGYKCPHIYGDPAVIMPLIYKPKNIEKIYDVSVVMHISSEQERKEIYHYIDVDTDDYCHFINEICKSKLIVSSSLHGIILAEAYGVSAIFLRNGIENEELKFYDWYFSTNRHCVVAIDQLEEYSMVTAMPLPQLDIMRENLIKSFPKDLWKSK